MIKDHRFWVGVIAGIVLYYVYTNYISKRMMGLWARTLPVPWRLSCSGLASSRISWHSTQGGYRSTGTLRRIRAT